MNYPVEYICIMLTRTYGNTLHDIGHGFGSLFVNTCTKNIL